MDDQSLRRIDRVLRAYPAAWDGDPDLLDELLAAAAEREAAGQPVAESNPELAAYLALYPEAAADYRELVWMVSTPADDPVDQATVDQILARLDAPAPAARPEGRGYLLPPRQLQRDFTSRARSRAAEATTGDDASFRRYPIPVPESQIELTIELLRQDDLGALIVRLEAEGDDVAELIDADAQLFSAPPEAAPSLAQPFASAPLDADHSATFTELELNETVYLLVRLARSAPLLLTIEASWWPA